MTSGGVCGGVGGGAGRGGRERVSCTYIREVGGGGKVGKGGGVQETKMDERGLGGLG